VILIVALAGFAPAAAAGPKSWRYEECRFQSLNRGTWTSREEVLTARCAVAKWTPAGGFAKVDSVISCESGWNRFAYNPAGPYVSLAQHALSAWPYRLRSYRPAGWSLSPRWQNARSALVVTVRMAASGGWGPWSCA
jgi:hypothetical protein